MAFRVDTLGCGVTVSRRALRTLHTYRYGRDGNEAGGILLGRVSLAMNVYEVLIEVATPPTPRDLSGPRSFCCAPEDAQHAINFAWRISGGRRIYLGEWHSHSETAPSPSPRDRKMIRGMVQETEMEIGFLLLIITGTEALWIGVDDGKALRHTTCSRPVYESFILPERE